ncbi:MAG: rod-binding protein [Erythrobacter sp.]
MILPSATPAPVPLTRPAAQPAGEPGRELTPEQAQLRKAAEGFEAIMLRRMLETARASSMAEETPLTGGGMKQFQQMRDERLADIAAATGAFGFARSIEAQLAQYLAAHNPATTEPASKGGE